MSRLWGSNWSIISIDLIFGVPVMDPPGKESLSNLGRDEWGFKIPSTILSRWCTLLYDLSSQSALTFTLPGIQFLPRSLRNKSTIIKFSARSFSLLSKRSAFSLSIKGFGSLGSVPLIGLVSTYPSVDLINLSGDPHKTSKSSWCK